MKKILLIAICIVVTLTFTACDALDDVMNFIPIFNKTKEANAVKMEDIAISSQEDEDIEEIESKDDAEESSEVEIVAPKHGQKLVLTTNNSSSIGSLQMYEFSKGSWQLKYTCVASYGKNGCGKNYGEGKGVTPKGEFKLGTILSPSAIPYNSDWPCTIISATTCIVDDVNSPLYNTIQDKNALSKGTSYDPIGDTIVNGNSEACMYIEHNGNGTDTNNVQKGKGSAITLCGRRTSLSATAGCVDISSSDFRNIVSLLDYGTNPVIEIK